MKLLLCATAALLSGAAESVDAADILEMEFRLVHGMGPGSAGGGKGASLLVDVTRTDGRWERVWAIDADSRRLVFFTGCVTTADVSSRRVALEMLVRIKDVARIHLDMKRMADGTLEGTYTIALPSGTFRGKADGRIKPRRPPLPAGFVPVQPGERPRILSRKTDLPALKEKLRTPLGRVLFEKMGGKADADAIGAGIKYQLTERREFADQARAFAKKQAYVMVAVLGRDGAVVPGFEAEKCVIRNEDRSDIRLKWGSSSARQLAGRSVRLRFFLRSANIYAVTAAGPSGGRP